MVTLAPELPGGLDAVGQLVDAGVVAAIGHTDATYDIARQALDAGASVGTHLFNAMRPLHHREPGPVGALLDSDARRRADRRRGAPAPGRAAHGPRSQAGSQRAGHRRDGGAAAADGDYRLGPMAVEVRDGVARLADGTAGAIAGSTLTMDAAVRYCVARGRPLLDVVDAASTAPARAWGLDDVGALEAGRRADLVVLDDDLHVVRTMRAGAWVNPSSTPA